MADPDPIRFNLNLDAQQFATELARQEKGMNRFRDAFVTAAGAIVAAQAGFRAVRAAMRGINEEIDRIGTLQGIQQSFERLATSVGGAETFLNRLRKATDGTIRDVELMRVSNQALQLGLATSGEQFAELADLAQRMGRSVGQDATKSIEGLVRALSRGSARGLARLNIDAAAVETRMDALAEAMGKTTSQLSDQEKMTLLVQAATDQMRSTVEKLGPEQLTVAELWGQIGTQTGTALDRLRIWLADSPEFQAALKGMAEFMSELTKQGGGLDRLMESLSAEDGSIPALGDAFKGLVNFVVDAIAAWSQLKVEVNDLMIFMIETVSGGLVKIGRVVASFLGDINKLLGGRADLPQDILDFLNSFESESMKIARGLRVQKEQFEKDANDVLAVGANINTRFDQLVESTTKNIKKAGAAAGAVDARDAEAVKKAKSPFAFGKEMGQSIGQIAGASRQLFSAMDAAFTGSGKSAERWKKVQLGVTAAISAAESVKEFAFGMAEIGNVNIASATAHFISSAAFALSAGVAGAQAAGAIPMGGGRGAAGGTPGLPQIPDIEDEDRNAQITRVNVFIEGDLVAPRNWIRTRVIPQVNEVVKRREGTVLATQAESAKTLDESIRTSV